MKKRRRRSATVGCHLHLISVGPAKLASDASQIASLIRINSGLRAFAASPHNLMSDGARGDRIPLESALAKAIGLEPALFGIHSHIRTKATLIYRGTGNFRAVQLFLGHSKIESTVRYLGVEVEDALAIADQVDV